MNQKYIIRYKLGSGSFRVYNNEMGEITTMQLNTTFLYRADMKHQMKD